MPRTYDQLTNWGNGVNTAGAADTLSVDTYPRGFNTHLVSVQTTQQRAKLAKRRGMLTLNTTPVTGSAGVLAGFQFRQANGTKTTLLVSDTGRLDKLNADNSLSVINAVAFTSGIHYPIFAVANDLCFIVNEAGDQTKFDGTGLSNFGIVRPAAPTVAAAAGGSMAAGTYDVALTYFNSATGQESSLSDFTTITTVAGTQKLNVSWPAPTDTQVTHVRVFIRQQAAGANVYRVVAGATPAPNATFGGFPTTTTATVLDISATQYGAFVIQAPTTSENNPPPTGLKYPCWHNSRLFLADSGNLYYSVVRNNQAFPESFDPNNVEPVNPNDGDRIMGLVSMSGRLLIFKEFALYALDGTDPASWTVSLVSANHGLSSMRSLVIVGGIAFWWANTLGPVAYDGSGLPAPVGKEFLDATLGADVLNQLSFATVVAGVDEANQTILWAVPEGSATRNTRIIPFHYGLRRFEADKWDPMDVCSMWQMETADQLQALYMGGYSGQVFQWWAASNDGVPGGTTAHGTVTSATSTTLTDASAAFATSGGKLVERYVYVLNSDRSDVQRRRIIANTGTQLTVDSAWDTTPNSSYTYVVGGIDFQLDTPWVTGDAPLLKKRFEFLMLEASSPDPNVTIDVDLFVSNDLESPKVTKSATLLGSGALYDASTSVYDQTKFAGAGNTLYARLRCGCVGRSWRARLRNCQADQDLTVIGILMQALPMNLKH